MTKDDIKKKIIDSLTERTFGLTIEDISKIVDVNRATASKYLLVLSAEKKIISRTVGKAKVHYLRTKELEMLLDA
ncbi:MAG: hypothetical protein GQ477_05580 [Nanohaloarchaea archaeon]|nr:hypothetical protein [Candidatus Nanohaloarchaea archaeon]